MTEHDEVIEIAWSLVLNLVPKMKIPKPQTPLKADTSELEENPTVIFLDQTQGARSCRKSNMNARWMMGLGVATERWHTGMTVMTFPGEYQFF
jgi:hypothetical protein